MALEKEDSLSNLQTDEYHIDTDSDPPEEDGIFSFLDEFNLVAQLAIANTSEVPKDWSKIELKMEASSVKVNMNPQIYNHVINLHKLFRVESYDEMITSDLKFKENIIN